MIEKRDYARTLVIELDRRPKPLVLGLGLLAAGAALGLFAIRLFFQRKGKKPAPLPETAA
jgi:hypothetical protein